MDRLKKLINQRYFLTAVTWAICLCIVVFVLSAFHGKHDFSAEQREGAHRFGASYMTMNNPFYSVINEEIRAVVDANGDILITRDPAMDADRQAEQIYDLIGEGVEAIFVTPVDYQAILPAIRAAKEKGIYIISVDTQLYEKELADCSVVSDNYTAGVEAANYLMRMKESARIVLLKHDVTQSGLDRMAGFMDTLAGHEGFAFVAGEQCEGQLETAMPAMQRIIESGVDFDTVFALNDPAALGAMAALEENGIMEEVCVLGVDGSPEAKSMIKEGLMMATSAQFPTRVGQIAVKELYDRLDGKVPGMQESGRAEVVVPVELITKENVDKFGTDNWQ